MPIQQLLTVTQKYDWKVQSSNTFQDAIKPAHGDRTCLENVQCAKQIIYASIQFQFRCFISCCGDTRIWWVENLQGVKVLNIRPSKNFIPNFNELGCFFYSLSLFKKKSNRYHDLLTHPSSADDNWHIICLSLTLIICIFHAPFLRD